MRTPAQALAAAEYYSRIGYRFPVGFCLGAVRTYFGAPARYATAAANWYASPEVYCHYNANAPAGYPVSWLGGQHGAGHVVISAGGGYCYSTDFGPNGYVGDGRVRKCSIASIHQHDYLLRFRGWASWLEGVRLPNP